MMRRLTIVLLAALACGISRAGDAEPLEDAFGGGDITTLNSIVVTGTRTPRLLKETPVQTRVISREEILKADATNIQDLLQTELPGVEFTYAMNQQVTMNLSGFSGLGILFLVDGEPLAGETLDNIDFTRLSMNDVERVEIVQGATSALYGSSAAGGVINIITRQDTVPWTLHADGRYAHHNQQRYNLRHSLRQGLYAHTLTFSRTSSDGYDVHNADGAADARTFSHVFGDDTWQAGYRMQLDPTDNLRLGGRLGFFRRTVDRAADMPERYYDYTAGLRGEWTVSERDRLEASWSFDQYDKSRWQSLAGLNVRQYSNVRNAARLLYSHRFRRSDMLTLGADYLYDYLMSNNIETPARQQSFDLYGQYDWRISSRWELVGALRYDWLSERSLSRLTPKLSACYRPADRWTLRASYGMGFRAPSLKERYHDFDMAGIWIVEGNPDLLPETSHSVQLSGEVTVERWVFTLSGRYARVFDRIATGIPYHKAGDERQLYLTYLNLGDQNVYGAEASVSTRWTCGLGLKLDYAFCHEDVSGETANAYTPIRPHSLTARLDWERKLSSLWALNVGLSGRALSSVDNTEFVDLADPSRGTRSVHYPGYSLWRLQAGVRFHEGATLTATVDNLFNYRPDCYYYNAPLTTGTNFLIGLSLDIERLCSKR